MVISLGSITIVMAAILAYVNYATRDTIAKLEEKALNDGIKEVILCGNEGELLIAQVDTVSGSIVYSTTDVAGKYLGSAVQTIENGFGGELKILVGFNADGNILGYRILSTAETPGLGVKADNWFQKGNPGDIINKQPEKNNLTVSKDGGEVDAITASTITSRAFLKGINNAYQAFRGNTNVDGATGATTHNK